MKRTIAFLIGLGLLAAGAIAQTVSLPAVVSVGTTDLLPIVPRGQPSAAAVFTTPSLITNTAGYVITVPLTAFTLTFTNGQTYWLIQPAGTLATGTFTTEPNPGDGARMCVRSTQTQSAVTITANTGQTIGGTAVTAMTANTTYCWLYQASATTWYPI